jgi:16S rRNA (guanine527-N7)-methyltransferase
VATTLIVARDFRSRLQRRSRRAGLSLDARLTDALTTYFELLARWNQKINLTSITQPDEAIDRLLLEPLLAARYLPPDRPLRLMDIGSGGGSPAIPLKLASPSMALTMVESKVRKSAFLREAVRQLALDATSVETARYEELLTRPELHEATDIVSLRAVRTEPRILMNLQAFLKTGGWFFLFRSASGGDPSGSIPPPLALIAAHPLVESLRSRLQIIEKQPVGQQTR